MYNKVTYLQIDSSCNGEMLCVTGGVDTQNPQILTCLKCLARPRRMCN